MNAILLKGLAAAVLFSIALSAAAQNVRYEQYGTAYITAEDQWIADRLIDEVVGTVPAAGAQVVFYRGEDGFAQEVALGDSSDRVIRLPRSTSVAFRLAPGTHTFMVNGQSVSVVLLSGNRSFVRITRTAVGSRLADSNALTFLRIVTGKRDPLYASN